LKAIVILALAAAAGYYVYTGVMQTDEAPSCSSAFNACLKGCRRSATEAPAMQACQQDCQREADKCQASGRRP
jgi:hypothetical protein